MIHVPDFEQFIGRYLGDRERDLIAWLDWSRRLTGRLAALVHDPEGRYAPLILAYLDWLAYATYDRTNPHIVLAPDPVDARDLADWCTRWPTRAGALSRHKAIIKPGHTYPRALIIDAHLAARHGRHDTLYEAIGRIIGSYGETCLDHAIIILGDATVPGTFADCWTAAPYTPDGWFTYDTAAPSLGPPPDIDSSQNLVGTHHGASAADGPQKIAKMAIKAKIAIPHHLFPPSQSPTLSHAAVAPAVLCTCRSHPTATKRHQPNLDILPYPAQASLRAATTTCHRPLPPHRWCRTVGRSGTSTVARHRRHAL